MSLVGIYCLCGDGVWYEEPVWHGKIRGGTYEWFVCLDDRDPPELVVQDGYAVPGLGWFEATGKLERTGWRVFNEATWVLKRAWRQFGRIVKTPPPPERWEAKYVERPRGEGVFYERGVF